MFRFFVAFYLCNTTFFTNKFLSSYISIASHVKISSNFFTKKHHVRSWKSTSYLIPKFLWLKFNSAPILVLQLWFLKHCHHFFLDQRFFNWIIHVNKFSIFISVSPIKSKFIGFYVIQHVPILFYKNLPIHFVYSSFPIFISKTTTFTFEWIQLHQIFRVWNQVIDQLKCVENSNWIVTFLHCND